MRSALHHHIGHVTKCECCLAVGGSFPTSRPGSLIGRHGITLVRTLHQLGGKPVATDNRRERTSPDQSSPVQSSLVQSRRRGRQCMYVCCDAECDHPVCTPPGPHLCTAAGHLQGHALLQARHPKSSAPTLHAQGRASPTVCVLPVALSTAHTRTLDVIYTLQAE